MVKGITLSLSDPAGVNMLQRFREKGFKETKDGVFEWRDKRIFVINHLIVPDERYKQDLKPQPYPIDYSRIATEHDLEYMVVASKHWGKSGKPSLTAHSTGNFGKAMYGGNPRELQVTAPNPMCNIYLNMLENPPEGFDVSLEATHHGPTEFTVPMFFVEIGSREEQWKDEIVGEYIVECILNGMDSEETAPRAIGIGGGHYCPTFNKYMGEYAMGHIAAKYAIELLDEKLVQMMVDKTGGADTVLLDKGLKGKYKRRVKRFIDKIDVEIS